MSRLEQQKRVRVYLDLTHLGRHVTGLERVSIEQFERVAFENADIIPVRSRGRLSMVWRQQLVLPLLALMHPRARFVFPGFPPSPFFSLIRNRVFLYVHDTFLLTRRDDLSAKARFYMAPQFAIAVRRLRNFFVNSEKTRADLRLVVPADATISMYRPSVANPFKLTNGDRLSRADAVVPLRIVSLGTIEPRKNYQAAIAILAALRTAGFENAEHHIIGREGWGDDGRAIAAAPGVIVHGYLSAEDAKSVIDRSDVYLCTSHDEGLGLPLLEVQFSGIAVVAPDQPVFREVLGASGTFISPSDAQGSARAILNLVSQHGWRQATAIAARDNVERWNALARGDGENARVTFSPTRAGTRADEPNAERMI